jgi:hypothetical protein
VALDRVRQARPIGDGRVAVINGITEEVLVVGPEGRHLRTLGGKGSGPAEFRYVISVFQDGEEIVAYDLFRTRLVSFRDGAFVEGRRIPPTGAPGPLYPEVVIPDGERIWVGDAFPPPGAVGGEPVRRLVLVAAVQDHRLDTLTLIPGDVGILKSPGIDPLPFGATYGMAKSPSGLWLGDSSEPRVTLVDATGRLRRIVRWRSSRDRTLTQQRIDQATERAVGGRSQMRARIEEAWERLAFPPEVPAWGSLLVGTDGTLWIGEYLGPEVGWPSALQDGPYPAQRWWAVAPDGRPVGTLVSPAGIEVTGFGPDYLVGVHRDELHVETVRRFGIRWRAGAR